MAQGKPFDTSMGGAERRFPDTPWSTILGIPGKTPDRRALLAQLCSLYWRPVYVYIRAAWERSNEDAKDLTQSFFCHILEDELLFRHDRRFGRFRTYLKVSLKNFLSNVHRDDRRLKRGGGATVIPLGSIEVEDSREDGPPDQQFDRQWVRDVLDQSLRDLKRRLEESGKGVCFQAYERYSLFPSGCERPTYSAIAEALNISVHEVKHGLAAARSMLHRLLTDRVSEYVESKEELDAELAELFSGLKSE